MNRDPEARKRKNFVMNLLHGKCGTSFKQLSSVQFTAPCLNSKMILNMWHLFTGFAQIHDYSYDVRKQKWCELTLSLSASRKSIDLSNVLKKAAEKAVIYEIKNIKRGIIGKGMCKSFTYRPIAVVLFCITTWRICRCVRWPFIWMCVLIHVY